MRYKRFESSFAALRERSPIEIMRAGRGYVVIGDLRMGDGGKRDELEPLRGLVETVLSSWYLKRDFTLVLDGDTEDLRNFWLKDIRSAWPRLYGIFDRFAAKARLRKILGERDLGLLRKPRYPYPLSHGLRLAGDGLELFILHGHQAFRHFAGRDYRDFVTDYLENPRRIRDEGDTTDPDRVCRAEKRLYRGSVERGIVTIFGHSGRRLFEARDEGESLRSLIERLLRESNFGYGDSPYTVDAMIKLYKERYREIERGGSAPLGLEEGEGGSPAPCLFNPGLAAGRRGMDAIELEEGTIRLVRWTRSGRQEAGSEAAAGEVRSLEGPSFVRLVQAEAELGGLAERIALFRPDRHRVEPVSSLEAP